LYFIPLKSNVPLDFVIIVVYSAFVMIIIDYCGLTIPVGARFFAHVQTGPEAHSASCTRGTGSFRGVKRPGRDADHPPLSSAEVKKE
jgi:hypothetical protein